MFERIAKKLNEQKTTEVSEYTYFDDELTHSLPGP